MGVPLLQSTNGVPLYYPLLELKGSTVLSTVTELNGGSTVLPTTTGLKGGSTVLPTIKGLKEGSTVLPTIKELKAGVTGFRHRGLKPVVYTSPICTGARPSPPLPTFLNLLALWNFLHDLFHSLLVSLQFGTALQANLPHLNLLLKHTHMTTYQQNQPTAKQCVDISGTVNF